MNIFEELIDLMNHAEQLRNKSGYEKKEYVLNELKLKYPVAYNQYRPIFDMVIDGLVKISKKDIKLALNKMSLLSKFCCK